MIKDIVKDIADLQQPSTKFNFNADRDIITDLLDTANAYKDRCLGLAAVQIGYHKNAFVIQTKKGGYQAIINPSIIRRSKSTYISEEGCLSLEGSRKVARNSSIDIIYSDITGKMKMEHVEGLRAQIMQHEFDHLQGKLI